MESANDSSHFETDEDIAWPVLEPLVEAARGLGLEVRHPQVLGAGANVVVHLTPSPVVARVATLTAEMRGTARNYLRRERSISAALDALGMNIITPTDLVDPGPHALAGQEFLLLKHRPLVALDLDSPAHAELAGSAFAELSAVLADLPETLDGCGEDPGQPWAEIATLTQTVRPTTDAAAIAKIAAVTQQLSDTEPDDPWQLVHGDAHRNNVALLDNQIVWFDFEDANLRPLTWDLATLRRSWPAAGDAACRLLDVDPESPSMLWHHELRELYALLWSLLYAQRYTRYRAATAERLEDWMSNQ